MKNMFRNQDKLIKLLTALFPECKVYLFGSLARGTDKPSSDVDLAIDAGRRLELRERTMALNIIEAMNIPQKVDLVDLNSKIPDSLKENIFNEGILL